MKKKLLALTLGLAVTLTSSAAFAMTTQEAKDLADTFVPDDAKYYRLMNLKDEIEFYYYSDTNRYEVEFDTKREMVKGFQVDRITALPSSDKNISRDEAVSILNEYYPDAVLQQVTTYQEHGRSIYELDFLLKGAEGEMHILHEGTVIEIDIDY